MKRCPKCNYEMWDDARICHECGFEMPAAVQTPPSATVQAKTAPTPVSGPPLLPRACPFCQEPVSAGQAECPVCGSSLTARPPRTTRPTRKWQAPRKTDSRIPWLRAGFVLAVIGAALTPVVLFMGLGWLNILLVGIAFVQQVALAIVFNYVADRLQSN